MPLFRRRLRPSSPPPPPARSKYVSVDKDYPDGNYPPLRLRPWDYGGAGDGYGFETADGAHIWPAGKAGVKRWANLGVYTVPVVGLQYWPDSSSVSLNPGRAIRLVAEPHNPHDPNAIAVHSWIEGHQAGHIPKDKTRTVRRIVADGPVSVMALSSYAEAGQRTMLRIVVFKPGRLLDVPRLPTHPPLD